MTGDATIRRAIEAAQRSSHPALAAFLTAGFPDRSSFAAVLSAVAGVADVVEIGVPFSDPMADGVTVQRASHVALQHGVTLEWILQTLRALPAPPAAPLLLMSYLNPLLAYGLERLVSDLRAAGVSGLIVPDLPLEEQRELRNPLDRAGVALVQLVTPVTPQERLELLCQTSGGFVYAVTVTGITGGAVADQPSVVAYLQRVKSVAKVPVMAGFGVRSALDVQRLAPPADGVIVGSALIECLERGADPAAFLRSLRVHSSAGERP
ncbi:MAG: tryptophan synthase subunit alpha [Acidobacteriota bacterium]